MKQLVYYLKQVVMKPMKTIRLLLIFSLAALVVVSCKKDELEQVEPDSSPVQQLATDDNSVEQNMDEAMADAGRVLSGNFKSSQMGIPCGATLDTTIMVNDTIIHFLSYDGLNCLQTKYRKGKMRIKIKQSAHWLLPGSFLKVELEDFEITNVFTNNKMTINGMSSLENVSGGIIELLGNGFNTIIHKNMAHVFISFNGHPPRDWHLAKMLVYSGNPGNLMLAINGFGVTQGHSNLLSWGTDREGQKFFTQIEESITFKEVCQWVPHAGVQTYMMPGAQLHAKAFFGYNSNNEPISGSECPTHVRLDWHQHGHSGTIYLPL